MNGAEILPLHFVQDFGSRAQHDMVALRMTWRSVRFPLMQILISLIPGFGC